SARPREGGRQLGGEGAASPWRTIRGQEGSGYGPAGTAACHINADIADAAVRYINVTTDEDFERECGLEILVETARMWRGLGHYDRGGQFHLDGVTGPDEYSALASDNVYTNLMAQRNLLAAADTVERPPPAARELGVDDCEAKAWREAAAAMHLPTTTNWASTRRPKASPATANSTSPQPAPAATRCCCTS